MYEERRNNFCILIETFSIPIIWLTDPRRRRRRRGEEVGITARYFSIVVVLVYLFVCFASWDDDREAKLSTGSLIIMTHNSNNNMKSAEPDALFCGGGISFVTGAKNGGFSYGYSTFKGKRASMEDFYHATTHDVNGQMVAFFAVFDGHGGSRAAEYLKANLFNNLIGHPNFISDTKTAIVEAFKQTDENYLEGTKDNQKDAGSTATTALLIGDKLFVANVGDSRTVASKSGSAVALSVDHKPDRSDERQRIEKAGGFILWAGTWRVGGVLAVSRAFGDKLLKPFVIAEPEIQEEDTELIDFIIIASDGLWNVISNKDAVDLVRGVSDAEAASRRLIEEAYARGSSDNITCVVVRFGNS
ncbi:hypothetical protein LUZ60_004277 [Juncus effusus]|nr:hypothetical protein LUZ60_004277 [Juncus effusus]